MPLLITGNTFNGANIIGLPSDLVPAVLAARSIEWDRQEVVAANASPFTGQTQTYDWAQSWWEGQVSFPPLDRQSYDYWNAFLALCRGQLNVFQMGDPKAQKAKGMVNVNPGTPVVNGANQTGYSLNARGFPVSINRLFLPGDYIQIGYRLYTVDDVVNSDSAGDAVLPVWPPLRDLPADGTAIVTYNCKGLFRLKNNSGNKSSVNVGAYGLSGFAIKEAI
jgi:hypothetical protein